MEPLSSLLPIKYLALDIPFSKDSSNEDVISENFDSKSINEKENSINNEIKEDSEILQSFSYSNTKDSEELLSKDNNENGNNQHSVKS